MAEVPQIDALCCASELYMHRCATQEAHGRLLQAKADLADASWQHIAYEPCMLY